MSREFVTGFRSCVLLGMDVSLRTDRLMCVPRTYFKRMCLRLALGISRTKTQRTLNTPFHLSDCHTVLLRE